MWKSPGSAQARMSHRGDFFEEWVGEASDAPADDSAACRRMHYWGGVLGLENFPIPTSIPQETGWTLLQMTQDEKNSFHKDAQLYVWYHLSQDLTLLGVEVVRFLPQLLAPQTDSEWS